MIRATTHDLSVGAALFACLFVITAGAASAAPVLQCQINQGGESRVLEFEPVTNPYEAKPVMIGKSFQFKALVFGTKDDIDYINLYTYGRTDRGPVLIHEARYLHPQRPVTMPEPASLTGWVSVYTPPLGRELQYACTMIGSAE